MVAMEVFLDKKKSFNMSMEEFAVLEKVYTFMGRLGYGSRCSLIGDLESFLDEEEDGLSNEVNLQEKAAIQLLITKLGSLTDGQAQRINEAFEKSQALFDIFYFFDPIERLTYIEPLVPAQQELITLQKEALLTSQTLFKEQQTSTNKAMKIAAEAIGKIDNTTSSNLKPAYVN
ncbi:hypothetical protein [Clostridium sp. CF012]|uniref:hypothetical protein n=1 Tax=Clostridium sp. CF012 TaxID=2843319 RepID=UPI001C0B306F|nr:hypothetical protein [Clostridium sp. CF012]MBU3142235.1 hypothetical protein [Clostridium sp. CF012]